VDLHIRGNGITVNDDLRDFVEKRSAKLDHLLGRVVDAKLELRSNHNRVGPDTVTAQLTIQTGRRILRAEEHDPEARAAIDRTIAKLERQLRRFHDKRADRKGPQPDSIRTTPPDFGADGTTTPSQDLTDDDAGSDDDEDAIVALVRTKRFSVKPMDVTEAIAQMELLQHDFYLFHNEVEDGINVVYRRRDGSYGLLAPELG
jgi:putative sigma-54 modulation protein